MNKKTKRAKRVSNKTKNRRYRGGAITPQDSSSVKPEGHFKPSEGIFTLLGNKIKGLATGAVGYVEDKGLRLVGLQKVDNGETPTVNAETANIDNQLNAVWNHLYFFWNIHVFALLMITVCLEQFPCSRKLLFNHFTDCIGILTDFPLCSGIHTQ